jgi:hypothetical protein
MSLRILTASLLLSASLVSSGCFFRKNKPQPPAAPLPAPPPAAASKPDPIPPPPKVQPEKPDLAEGPPAAQEIDVPKPPPAPPRRPRRPVAQTPAPAPAETNSTNPPAPAPDPPRLVQLLTPAEERRYQEQLDQYLKNVDVALGQAAARSLSAGQTETVQRVREFAQQARDQRASDLVTAHNLALRANVLAQDLLRSFR